MSVTLQNLVSVRQNFFWHAWFLLITIKIIVCFETCLMCHKQSHFQHLDLAGLCWKMNHWQTVCSVGHHIYHVFDRPQFPGRYLAANMSYLGYNPKP